MSGKVVVLLMFMLALAAAVGRSLYLAGEQREPVGLWGREAAMVIIQAPHWEALELGTGPAPPGGASLAINGRWYTIQRRKALDDVSGALDMRSSLTDKKAFDWDAAAASAEPAWRWALRFYGEHGQATVVFAPSTGQAQLLETGAKASMAPRMPAIDDVMRRFFPPAEEPKPSQPGGDASSR